MSLAHVCWRPYCQFLLGWLAVMGWLGATRSLPLIAQTKNDSDWIDLFDGSTLTGWTQRGGKAQYTVADGVIVGETVANTPNSFLCTEVEYADFELQLEVWVHPELNSGIQIRSQSIPDYKDGQVHGYQIEIDPSDRAWTAGIYDESRRGWLADLSRNPKARYAFRQSQWNQIRIVASGSQIMTWLNGVPAAELVDEMTPQGFIALQVHGVGGRQDPLQVRFRNIRLRPLTAASDISEHSPDHQQLTPPSGKVFDANARIEKIVSGLQFAEGPTISPTGELFFSDIPANKIHRVELNPVTDHVFSDQSGNSNGLAFAANGALIACESGTRVVARLSDNRRTVIAEKFEDRPLNSPNDLALDGVGGIYFTDPRYGDRSSMALDFEGVFYLNAQRQIKLIDRNLKRPNGIALSPDYQILYVADHAAGKLYRYDVRKPGEVGPGQVIADVGSDGMTVDAFGRILVTWGQEVIVLLPTGEIVDRLTFPESPTHCELHKNWLLVTTPTSVYRVKTNTQSLLGTE